MIENEKSKSEQDKDDYKAKLKLYEEELYKLRRYSEQSYDKYIVYLSSGGLVISFNIIKEILSKQISTNYCLIFFIILLYFLALFTNLISHKFAKYTMDAELIEDSIKSTKYNLFAELLNWSSLGLFIIGSILLMIFIGVTFYGK